MTTYSGSSSAVSMEDVRPACLSMGIEDPVRYSLIGLLFDARENHGTQPGHGAPAGLARQAARSAARRAVVQGEPRAARSIRAGLGPALRSGPRSGCIGRLL